MSKPIEIFEAAAKLLGKGKRVALCTIVEKIGSGPAEKGGKMLVAEDGEMIGTIGGGKCFERGLKERALKAIREGKPTSLKFAFYGGAKEDELDTGLWCGGTMTVFIDVIEPRPKLVIVGSGDIALPTYRMADLLGFDITVVDDMEDTLTKDRFPNAELIYDEDFEKALGEVKAGGNTYVAIVHGEPKHDLAALRRFVRERTAYLGILGSKTKMGKLMGILRKDGVPEEAIKRISGPIGLDIGAKTPAEIAVSIVAELVEKMRKSS
ncbi:MAG: XdhC/CoxI family protein [Candidatus Hodarchaeaceae archaeon]|nr:XdhC/CoxI family protein [Candidatus Hodarchaeaceae archaeon]